MVLSICFFRYGLSSSDKWIPRLLTYVCPAVHILAMESGTVVNGCSVGRLFLVEPDPCEAEYGYDASSCIQTIQESPGSFFSAMVPHLVLMPQSAPLSKNFPLHFC